MKDIRFHRVNLARHGVTPAEAGEALEDGWSSRRRDGDHYEVLGQTDEGRYLQLVVEDLPEAIRVFHGRDMNERERRRFRRK